MSDSFPDAGGLGIYVHLPFCRVHCAYCAFAVSTDLGKEPRYTEALLREIELQPKYRGSRVDTLFFGGGTPSRTPPESLRRVVDALRNRFDLSALQELTLEANPEDVDEASLAAWRELGVDRLSIGVQSLHDSELRPIGRVHGPQRARDAITAALHAGFRTSLDLILGLPHQTSASFRETLARAIELGVGHLSLYMLDLEEGSPLERHVSAGRIALPEDENVAALYREAIAQLTAADFEQYEISNFARRGEVSLHNLRYWQRVPYLGFGLSAHSFVGEERWGNTRDLGEYLERLERGELATGMHEHLTAEERRRELIFLGLRQAAGIHSQLLENLCGSEGVAWSERGLAEGWLCRKGDRVAFTADGFLLSNSYLSELF